MYDILLLLARIWINFCVDMNAEKVILSFFALLTGLIVAGIAFYFIQSAKLPQKSTTSTVSEAKKPTPTPNESLFLSIDTPKDQQVIVKKTITVSGKTQKDAIVVISTPIGDDVITPSQNGDFSATVTIDDGENAIYYTAIASDGTEKQIIQTITYSTEEF